MGSPLSGTMAEIFLQHLENSHIKPRLDSKRISFYSRELLHLVGILFPHINDDARSKSHQIYKDYSCVCDDIHMHHLTCSCCE